MFIYELHRARSLGAIDPRDHVFAFLGHYSARTGIDGTPILEANYTKSTEEIYHEVAIRTLIGVNSLLTLNAIHHRAFKVRHGTNLVFISTHIVV